MVTDDMREFEDALSSFVGATLAALRSARVLEADVPQRPRAHIVEEKPGSYRTETRAEVDWFRLVARHHRLVYGLPEFKTLVESSQATPLVRRHMETPAHVPGGGGTLSMSIAAARSVEEAMRRSTGLDASRGTIADVARAFVEFLAAEGLDQVICVPVLGLTIDGPIENVHVGYDLVPLGTADRETLIDEEDGMAWKPLPGDSWGHAWAELRRTVTVGKWEPPPAESRVRTEQVQADAEAILTALRLVAGNTVRLAGIIVRPKGWKPLDSFLGRSGPGDWTHRIRGWSSLSDSDGQRVRELAGLHSSAIQERRWAYEEAARRMRFGAERDRPEDTLVDYMIALEAILLADNRPELAYRLALRCAATCAKDPDRRAEVFSQTTRAYTLRGDILHGSSRKETFAATLREATSACEELLRAVLTEYLTNWVTKPVPEFLQAVEQAVTRGEPLLPPT